MNKRSCAVICASPLSFPWGYDEEHEDSSLLKFLLSNSLSQLLDQGISRFHVVLDSGAGLYAAEAVLARREGSPEIALFCHASCEEQAVQWPSALRERYFDALAASTASMTVAGAKTPSCEMEAGWDAVDQSDIVLAVLPKDTEDPFIHLLLKYAERRNRPVRRIEL